MVPLPRKARGIPVEVSLGPKDAIPVKSVANADSPMTIPRARRAAYLTTLSPGRMEAVARAIRLALALPG